MSSLSIDSNQLTLNAFSIGATQPISALQGLSDPTTTQGSDTTSSVDSSAGPAATTHISKQSQLLSKLQQLQQQDPAKFKQVVTDIATKLQDQAASATGDQQKALTDLASKFQKAESGDLSGFQPPAQAASGAAALYQQSAQNGQAGSTQATQGSKHGHHHHGGGKAGGGQQALSSIFAELNTALGQTSSSSSATSATTATTTQATGTGDSDNVSIQ